jgi:DNA-binding transcriptional MerR regulator
MLQVSELWEKMARLEEKHADLTFVPCPARSYRPKLSPELYALRDLAKTVGMSVGEVERLRTIGLLQPPRLTEDGSSTFHQEHVDRLTFIRHAQKLEFSVEDIARLVDSTAIGTCADVYGLADDHVRRLRQQPGNHMRAVREVERLMESCSRIGGRETCSMLAALSQRDMGG